MNQKRGLALFSDIYKTRVDRCTHFSHCPRLPGAGALFGMSRLNTEKAASMGLTFLILMMICTVTILMAMSHISNREQQWLDHELRAKIRAVPLRFRTGDLIFVKGHVDGLFQRVIQVHQETRLYHVGVVFIDTDGSVYGRPMVAYLCEYVLHTRHMTARPLGSRLANFLPGYAAVRRAGRQVPTPHRLREFLKAQVPLHSVSGPSPSCFHKVYDLKGYMSRFLMGCPEDASTNCMDAAVHMLRQAGLWTSKETVSHVDELLHADLSRLMPDAQPPEQIILE